jgi:hypothetical protein
MRVVLIVSAILLATNPARADQVWLVITASSSSAAAIAEKAKTLGVRAPHGLVVQTTDCSEKTNMFTWVHEVALSGEAAQAALSRARERVKDAYVKRCDAKPNSLLSLRMTAVDTSIADVPKDAVNWEDADRVTMARPLPDGRTLVIARYYVKVAEDPLEGRRERVILAESANKRIVLEENCFNPGSLATSKGHIAFDCAKEQAGDHLLHSVVVFDETGKKLKEIERCRRPRWTSDVVLVCEEESVDADGRLKLAPRSLSIGVSQWPQKRRATA